MLYEWRAFVRRSRFIESSNDLEHLVAEVRRFAIPLLAATAVKGSLSHWNAGGHWV